MIDVGTDSPSGCIYDFDQGGIWDFIRLHSTSFMGIFHMKLCTAIYSETTILVGNRSFTPLYLNESAISPNPSADSAVLSYNVTHRDRTRHQATPVCLHRTIFSTIHDGLKSKFKKAKLSDVTRLMRICSRSYLRRFRFWACKGHHHWHKYSSSLYKGQELMFISSLVEPLSSDRIIFHPLLRWLTSNFLVTSFLR